MRALFIRDDTNVNMLDTNIPQAPGVGDTVKLPTVTSSKFMVVDIIWSFQENNELGEGVDQVEIIIKEVEDA